MTLRECFTNKERRNKHITEYPGLDTGDVAPMAEMNTRAEIAFSKLTCSTSAADTESRVYGIISLYVESSPSWLVLMNKKFYWKAFEHNESIISIAISPTVCLRFEINI